MEKTQGIVAGTYRPHKHAREILTWTLERIKAVPYPVTARWVFYRIVQEKGFTKSSYGTFLQWTSRARKRFWNGWRPDTLIDDTRKAHLRGFGYEDANAWMESFKKKQCMLDKYLTQNYIVEIWFEAQAMYSQFDYYTGDYYVTLRPFKGDASIHFKWKIAKHLESLAAYEKPIVILYFGDYDEKGLKIPESAIRDIKAWCRVPFQFVRCGINKEHITRFDLIENPEKPGTYQWEALGEDAAKELILGNLEKFWSLSDIEKVQEREAEADEEWTEIVNEALGSS